MFFSMNMKLDFSTNQSLISVPPDNFIGAITSEDMSYSNYKDKERVALGYSFFIDNDEFIAFTSSDLEYLIQLKNGVLTQGDSKFITLITPDIISLEQQEFIQDTLPNSFILKSNRSRTFDPVRFKSESEKATLKLLTGEVNGVSVNELNTPSNEDSFFRNNLSSTYQKKDIKIPTPTEWKNKDFAETLFHSVEKYPKEYKDRLELELKFINENNFENIFKVVADYIAYAKTSGIEVGPGRGSVSNSLVSYLLNITEIDPIQFNLPFERFLNPERIRMPDIDIDFESKRVGEIHQYIKEEYGKNNVCFIRTFDTFKAKSAIRYVGKKLGIAQKDIEFAAKQIRNKESLRDALSRSNTLKKFFSNNREFGIHCLNLEGVKRSKSVHPAGLIISQNDLRFEIPLGEHRNGIQTSELQEKDLSELGYLKFDILSLSTLDFIKRLKRETNTDFKTFDLNDDKTFDLFSKGITDGIFQFESDGMKDTLKHIMPRNIIDLAVVNALYRPGPKDFIPHYIFNKERGFKYHYTVDEILKETYGIVIFQEQFNQILSILTNCSLGEADNVRRMLSKSDESEVKSFFRKMYADSFEMLPEFENRNFFFSMLYKMKDYSFPKGHAISYSLLSYRLAYYKANYPGNFVKELLELKPDYKSSLVDYLKSLDWSVLPPIRNKIPSDTFDESTKEYNLSYKHFNLSDMYKFESVLEKEDLNSWGMQRTLMEYCLALKKEDVEKLIFGSYFDNENNENKKSFIETIDHYYNLLEGKNFTGEEFEYFGLKGVPYLEYDYSDDVLISKEFESLGCYTGETLIEFLSSNVAHQKISTVEVNNDVTIIGKITSLRIIKTKKGDDMVFLQLDDESGLIDVVVFPNVLDRFRNELSKDFVVRVNGDTDLRNGKVQLIAKEIKRI